MCDLKTKNMRERDYCESHLFKKRRVDTKVFGHNVQTEKVAVDTRTSHGQTIHVLMLVCCLPKQGKSLGILITHTYQGDLISLFINVNLTLLKYQGVQSPGCTRTHWLWVLVTKSSAAQCNLIRHVNSLVI